ncbi:hypothetical protein [Kitasatospora sp. NPDC017646]|uniref:hypothetical protein n=1 Tax=Kitasatospora sp. NPDC017646 TaxID=3364024 RepID=UPI0037B868C5
MSLLAPHLSRSVSSEPRPLTSEYSDGSHTRPGEIQISRELQAHALALDELTAEGMRARQARPGAHCTTAAGFPQLTRELVRCAVVADREAGATWATIGEALGLSADAARAPYGKVRLLWPPPPEPA